MQNIPQPELSDVSVWLDSDHAFLAEIQQKWCSDHCAAFLAGNAWIWFVPLLVILPLITQLQLMIVKLLHCSVFIFEINKHFIGKYFEIIYTFHSLSDFNLLVKVSITFCFLVTKDDFPFLLLFLLYLLFGTPSQARALSSHSFIYPFISIRINSWVLILLIGF